MPKMSKPQFFRAIAEAIKVPGKSAEQALQDSKLPTTPYFVGMVDPMRRTNQGQFALSSHFDMAATAEEMWEKYLSD
jgi:hypothetical protein